MDYKLLLKEYDSGFYESVHIHVDSLPDTRSFHSLQALSTLEPWNPWKTLYYEMVALSSANERNESDTMFIVNTINECGIPINCVLFMITYPLMYRLFIVLSVQMNNHAIYSNIIEQVFDISLAYCTNDLMFERVTTILGNTKYHFNALEKAIFIKNEYAIEKLLKISSKDVVTHLLKLDNEDDIDMVCKYVIPDTLIIDNAINKPSLLKKLLPLVKVVDYNNLIKMCITNDLEESFNFLIQQIQGIKFYNYEFIAKYKRWKYLLSLCNSKRCSKEILMILLNRFEIPNDIYLSMIRNYIFTKEEIIEHIREHINADIIICLLDQYSYLLDRLDLIDILFINRNKDVASTILKHLRNK